MFMGKKIFLKAVLGQWASYLETKLEPNFSSYTKINPERSKILSIKITKILEDINKYFSNFEIG